NLDLALTFVSGSEPFQILHTRLTEAFGIGHDVGLCDRDEVRCTEEIADIHLMSERLLTDGALLPGQDILFLVVQLHDGLIPPSRPSRVRLFPTLRSPGAENPRDCLASTPSARHPEVRACCGMTRSARPCQSRRQRTLQCRLAGSRERTRPTMQWIE